MNGEEFVKVWAPFAAVIIALFSSVIGGVVWITHLEDRVVALEAYQKIQDLEITRLTSGLLPMGVIAEREQVNRRRIDMLEQRVNQRWGSP